MRERALAGEHGRVRQDRKVHEGPASGDRSIERPGEPCGAQVAQGEPRHAGQDGREPSPGRAAEARGLARGVHGPPRPERGRGGQIKPGSPGRAREALGGAAGAGGGVEAPAPGHGAARRNSCGRGGGAPRARGGEGYAEGGDCPAPGAGDGAAENAGRSEQDVQLRPDLDRLETRRGVGGQDQEDQLRPDVDRLEIRPLQAHGHRGRGAVRRVPPLVRRRRGAERETRAGAARGQGTAGPQDGSRAAAVGPPGGVPAGRGRPRRTPCAAQRRVALPEAAAPGARRGLRRASELARALHRLEGQSSGPLAE
mmetsp:Transcript_4012/g.10880  ORF Transcript_4012/g.10880 Transcript_4012/m.10880 type:complete len:311 (-) Transcript_4012:257-1189(-)